MQYKRVACAMVRKNFTWWCHGPAPQQAKSGQNPKARPRLERTCGGPVLTKTSTCGQWWTKSGTRTADAWRPRFGGRPKRTPGGTQGGHSELMADTKPLSGHMGETRRTRARRRPTRLGGADMADAGLMQGGQHVGGAAKADTGQTQGGHMGDRQGSHGWRKADRRRGQVGLKAGARRTRLGGHIADVRRSHTLPTSSGDAAGAYRQPFFLWENPTVNCLGIP